LEKKEKTTSDRLRREVDTIPMERGPGLMDIKNYGKRISGTKNNENIG